VDEAECDFVGGVERGGACLEYELGCRCSSSSSLVCLRLHVGRLIMLT
jgi:hypothetical protein